LVVAAPAEAAPADAEAASTKVETVEPEPVEAAAEVVTVEGKVTRARVGLRVCAAARASIGHA
tara:strand:+ start:143 stop:331 length:189 start_codon:yes stop_codon:yes gene_type:complete